jgi:ribose 5-phosphate isomerase B
MTSPVIVIGSDHAGVTLKQAVVAHLKSRQENIVDIGTDDTASVDYPDFGYAVAKEIALGRAAYGIVICGSGIGISIAANRHKDIRAALCVNATMAGLARQHNDANVLALGERLIDAKTAIDCVDRFLDTAFEGGRHQKRVEKLSNPPV